MTPHIKIFSSPWELLIVGLLILIGAGASARTVKIKWERVPEAARFDLKILQGGKIVIEETTDIADPMATLHVWRGDLPPGFFVYQIRSIDAQGKRSEWSNAKLLVVKPKATQNLVPAQGAKVILSAAHGIPEKVFVKWQPLGKRITYRVDLQINDKVYYKMVYETGGLELKKPVPGTYRWKVTPVIYAEGSVDSKLVPVGEREVSGTPTPSQEFKLSIEDSYREALSRLGLDRG